MQQPQQGFQWEVLDEVEIGRNQSKRFVFVVKSTPNNQLYVDMATCLPQKSSTDGRIGGLCLDLRTFIAVLLNIDDCLTRARQVINDSRFAGLYGLADPQEETASITSKSTLRTFRMRASLLMRVCAYLNSIFRIISSILFFSLAGLAPPRALRQEAAKPKRSTAVFGSSEEFKRWTKVPNVACINWHYFAELDRSRLTTGDGGVEPIGYAEGWFRPGVFGLGLGLTGEFERNGGRGTRVGESSKEAFPGHEDWDAEYEDRRPLAIEEGEKRVVRKRKLSGNASTAAE